MSTILDTWLNQIGGALKFLAVWVWASWLARGPIPFEVMLYGRMAALILGGNQGDGCIVYVRFTLPADVLPPGWEPRMRWFASNQPDFARLP